eukprot:RCo036944
MACVRAHDSLEPSEGSRGRPFSGVAQALAHVSQPSTCLVLLPGDYPPFTISDPPPGLTVTSLEGACVRVMGSLLGSVDGVAVTLLSAHVCTLRGLQLQGHTGVEAFQSPALEIVDCTFDVLGQAWVCHSPADVPLSDE